MIIAGSNQKYFGSQLHSLLRGLNLGTDISQIQWGFYKLRANDQERKFVGPAWGIAKNIIPQARRSISPIAILDKSPKGSPIIVAPKDGIDTTFSVHHTNNEFSVSDISIEQGGLGTNITTALRLHNRHSNLITLTGTGERGDFHRHLLEVGRGLDISQSIQTLADSSAHACLKVTGDQAGEYWFAPDAQRGSYNPNELDEFIENIKLSLIANNGQPLVLTSVPSRAYGDHLFSDLTRLGHQFSSPVILNMKEFDPNGGYLNHLFNMSENSIDYIKPNLREFVQIVRYSGLGLVQNSDEAERLLASNLQAQAERGNLSQIKDLAKKVLEKLPNTTLFISLGGAGALAINKKYSIAYTAPKIELGCTTGAGDSGLAALIIEAENKNIDLKYSLNDSELSDLLLAFIYESAATVSLPGSEIAGPDLYNKLRLEQALSSIIV